MEKIKNDLTDYVKSNLWRKTNLNVKSIIINLPEENMRLCLPFVGRP